MNEYISRMKEEFRQLESRIDKLELFINSDSFLAIPRKDQELLNYQLKWMIGYYSILEVRLACAVDD